LAFEENVELGGWLAFGVQAALDDMGKFKALKETCGGVEVLRGIAWYCC
jgi:hypothetical protein